MQCTVLAGWLPDIDPVQMGSKQFADYLKVASDKWGKPAKAAGIGQA